MATFVMCRACRQRFDREKLLKEVDWVMPSRNFYYHKKCYEDWKSDKGNIKATLADEQWISYIWDYLKRDLKLSVDYVKCESQRQNFIKNKHYTNKGIFFALKYFYEVKNGDGDKSEGGIGIVPYVYADSTAYWQEKYARQKEVLELIEKQMEERANRKVITMKPRSKRKEWQNSFDLIEELGDDE